METSNYESNYVPFPKRSSKEKTILHSYIKNKKEAKWVGISIVLAAVLIAAGFIYIPSVLIHQIPPETRHFRILGKNFGSLARLGFFFAIVLYPVFLLLKSKNVPAVAKKLFRFSAKYIRQWHVPIAMVASGLVTIHVYFALLAGIKWNGQYLSGMIAYLILGTLIYYGFQRYLKRDQNRHLILGFLFVLLFTLHTFL